MNVLIGILKFPPDFTGAGLRIEKMYTRLLKKRDLDHTLVFTTTPRNVKPGSVQRGRMEVFIIGQNSYINDPYSRFRRLKKLSYVLRSAYAIVRKYFRSYRKFDVVHTIDSSWLSTLIGWLAFLTNKPLVKEIVLIGTDDPLAVRKEKGGWIAPFFLFPFHYAKLIITISESLKNICVAAGLPPQKIWARHNPVYIEDTDDSSCPSGALESSHRKNILFVGTLIKRKNVEFLLEAAFFLKGHVTLLFAGPSEDAEYYDRLRHLAARLNEETHNRITARFLGWVRDRKKLAQLFLKSDLFWFASAQEGMGNVIIESLLYGTPVVTLPVCGIMRDIIRVPEYGEIVEDACPERFARAANRYLYQVHTDRASLQNRAKRDFNPQDIEKQHINHLKSLAYKS